MASIQLLVDSKSYAAANFYAGLIIDKAGNLYGTALSDGIYSTGSVTNGSVFKLSYNSLSGTYSNTTTSLAYFTGKNGDSPYGGLITDKSGNIYGTTSLGGANSAGTVFEIAYNASSGTYNSAPITLVSFNGTSGGSPKGNLIADAAGNLYGTTYQGGAGKVGTVFEVAYNSTTGTYSNNPITIASFNGANGAYPDGGLIFDKAGNLFGTTTTGGNYNSGTVFEIAYNSAAGTYSNTPITLASLNGGQPHGNLIADAAGNLFGTTQGGGTNNAGSVFEIAYNSATGSYSNTPITLASFSGASASGPVGSLITDAAGNLYGTTRGGGDLQAGSVFKIAFNTATETYGNTPITLASFNGTNGNISYGSLVSDTAGNLYGTTFGSGSSIGTIFKLTESGFAVGATAVQANFGTVTYNPHSPGGQVYALYQGLLGRAPDSLGLEYWADQFEHGASPATLTAGFLASPEGQARLGAAGDTAFVQQLYQNTLHRTPDAIGQQYWTDQLAHGTSRVDVADKFVFSPEYTNTIQQALSGGLFVPDAQASQVARVYYTMLGRAPDADGLQYWTSQINHGGTVASVAQSFLSTPENQATYGKLSNSAYVDALYVNALGRHAESSGLTYWTNQLDHGTSRADLAVSLSQSAESQNVHLAQIELGWHLV